MSLFDLFWISTVLILLITALYIILKIVDHKIILYNERKKMGIKKKNDPGMDIPDNLKIVIEHLFLQKNRYINNYIIFLALNKSFGIASVVYAVMGLLSQTIFDSQINGGNQNIESVIAFLSIVCVVIALYLSPTSRVSQYIKAWKKLNNMVNHCFANKGQYIEWGKLLTSGNGNSIETWNNNQSKPEQSKPEQIKNEVDRITWVIDECERLLSTDEE